MYLVGAQNYTVDYIFFGLILNLYSLSTQLMLMTGGAFLPDVSINDSLTFRDQMFNLRQPFSNHPISSLLFTPSVILISFSS